MTCEDCKHFKFCMERSRVYPCRDFETNDKTATTPNKTGVQTLVINYTKDGRTPTTTAQKG